MYWYVLRILVILLVCQRTRAEVSFWVYKPERMPADIFFFVKKSETKEYERWRINVVQIWSETAKT